MPIVEHVTQVTQVKLWNAIFIQVGLMSVVFSFAVILRPILQQLEFHFRLQEQRGMHH